MTIYHVHCYFNATRLLIFDLFTNFLSHNPSLDVSVVIIDITLVVCPGIGNSSETVALRTFSHHANEAGYRVAVLNHLGVIPTIPLTTSRIFNYGENIQM